MLSQQLVLYDYLPHSKQLKSLTNIKNYERNTLHDLSKHKTVRNVETYETRLWTYDTVILVT